MTTPHDMDVQARTIGFRAGERNVFLHILTSCNLQCKHCYINHEQHGTARLTREQIEKWIKLFAEPSKKTNLIILGGEPTLHPDLPFAIETAKKAGFNVTVDTNGYLFHDLLTRTSPDLLDYLSFSLDGPNPEVNDRIRGQGVFDICTANIARAVQMGYRVSLIYTVNRSNLEHLNDMISLLVRLKVRKFFIQVLGLRGRSAQKTTGQLGQVSREEWLAVVPEVAALAAREGIHVIYPQVFLAPEEHFECAGNVAENYFIFPNGRVYLCPLCEDHPINTHRIVDDRLEREPGLREQDFFRLNIAEGCVMNKLLQPDTIEYDGSGQPLVQISCCLLKKEIGGR